MGARQALCESSYDLVTPEFAMKGVGHVPPASQSRASVFGFWLRLPAFFGLIQYSGQSELVPRFGVRDGVHCSNTSLGVSRLPRDSLADKVLWIYVKV